MDMEGSLSTSCAGTHCQISGTNRVFMREEGGSDAGDRGGRNEPSTAESSDGSYILTKVLTIDEINVTACHMGIDCPHNACCTWASSDHQGPEWNTCMDCMLSKFGTLPWTARGIFSNQFRQRWTHMAFACASSEFLRCRVPMWPLQPATEGRDAEREILQEHGRKITDIAVQATTTILNDDDGEYITLTAHSGNGGDFNRTLPLVVSAMQWGILRGIAFTGDEIIAKKGHSARVWSKIWEEILPSLRLIPAFNILEYARTVYDQLERLTTSRLRSGLNRQRQQSWPKDAIYEVIGCSPFMFLHLMCSTMSHEDVRLYLYGYYQDEHANPLQSLVATEWPGAYFPPNNLWSNHSLMQAVLNQAKSNYALATFRPSPDGRGFIVVDDNLQSERHAFDLMRRREEQRFTALGVEEIVREAREYQSVAGRRTSVGIGNAGFGNGGGESADSAIFVLFDSEYDGDGNLLQMAALEYPNEGSSVLSWKIQQEADYVLEDFHVNIRLSEHDTPLEQALSGIVGYLAALIDDGRNSVILVCHTADINVLVDSLEHIPNVELPSGVKFADLEMIFRDRESWSDSPHSQPTTNIQGGVGFSVASVCNELGIPIDKKRVHTADYDAMLEATVLSELMREGTRFSDSALRIAMLRQTREISDRFISFPGVCPKTPLKLTDCGLLQLAGQQYVEEYEMMRPELLINKINAMIEKERHHFTNQDPFEESVLDSGINQHIPDLEKLELASEIESLKKALSGVSADLAYKSRQLMIYKTKGDYQAAKIARLEAELAVSKMENCNLVRGIRAISPR